MNRDSRAGTEGKKLVPQTQANKQENPQQEWQTEQQMNQQRREKDEIK